MALELSWNKGKDKDMSKAEMYNIAVILKLQIIIFCTNASVFNADLKGWIFYKIMIF